MDVACFQDHLRWIDWNACLDMELNNTSKSFDNFFTVINGLPDTYTLYKKLSLRETKLKKTMVDKRHINVYKSRKIDYTENFLEVKTKQ